MRGERFVIRDNLDELAGELVRRSASQACVVLASGDPLFYGIGSYLTSVAGLGDLRVHPATSSMQLAFARAETSWQQAAPGNIHGRDLRLTLLPLLGRPLVGLFTRMAIVRPPFRNSWWNTIYRTTKRLLPRTWGQQKSVSAGG